MILALALTSAACTWPRSITPNPNETAQQRVERLDREAEEARRCQAASNRRPDEDRRNGDLRGCPRN
ncbi:hypothetical protein [Brevundimonas sp.]|uniref:hypothetical protein n=1 Tax=Brevundimonas sp. TaxID=1871086 RepID=UPI002E1312B4|nr:hypothetical protein [Brevundimonas sp.]